MKQDGNADIELGTYKQHRGGIATTRISEAVKKMWEEAENNGQTLDGVPHLKRNQETEPILARLFQQMAKVDHTAYVYRIVPGTVKKAKQPDGNPPLIMGLSQSRVEAQQGSQSYSQSLGSNRWRIVPQGEDQYRTDKQRHITYNPGNRTTSSTADRMTLWKDKKGRGTPEHNNPGDREVPEMTKIHQVDQQVPHPEKGHPGDTPPSEVTSN